jgi:hypothetical protein
VDGSRRAADGQDSKEGKRERVPQEAPPRKAVFCLWLPLLLLSANQHLPSGARLIDRSSFGASSSALLSFPFNPLRFARSSTISVPKLSVSSLGNCLGLCAICDAFRPVCPPFPISMSRFSALRSVSLRPQPPRSAVSGSPVAGAEVLAGIYPRAHTILI